MDAAQARRILRQHLETDRLLGVETLPSPRVAPSAPPKPTPPPSRALSNAKSRITPQQQPQSAPAATPAAQPRLTPDAPVIDIPDGDKAAALDRLRERLHDDPQQRAKCMPGTQLVFGEGDPDAQIMFIGEGAGEDEARTGRPFVGRAGQLLDNMIKAMGLDRSAVYITNCVHFRPPGNRTPTPDEVALGWPYMIGQVQIVRPKVIVALGGTSAKALLDTSTGITRLRGQWNRFDAVQPPIDLMPTFHPAFLLRSYTTDNRKKVWSDLLAVLDKLGLEAPSKS